jgi:hypothetical protein
MGPGFAVNVILSVFLVQLRTTSSADDTLEFQKTRKFRYQLLITISY